MDVKDRVAVVTGSASGIGRGIGLALAEKRCHVVVADLDEARAAEAASEIAENGVRTLAAGCDVSSEQSVEELAERAWSYFGHVDLLFNNAGTSAGGLLLDSAKRDLEWLFGVNVFGVWYGCSVFGRRFRDQGTQAWIVNTGSEHSLGVPHLQAGLYTATKHAVLALSDVLRRELPPFIGVSLLCPGVVRTRLWEAPRRRPAELGGPSEPSPLVQQILDRGIDPLEVGRRTVEGVERGDFYIVTHAHARRFAEERCREVLAAFDSQVPYDESAERYDVTRIAMEVLSRHREENE